MNPEWFRFNHSFCPAAFMQLHLDTGKNKRLCCFSDHVIDDSLSFNSEQYKKIRQDMLDNHFLPACLVCQTNESKQIISHRQRYLQDIKNKEQSRILHAQIEQHEQGHDLTPFWYDLRISNNCNLACQICGPSSSSTIAKNRGIDNPYLRFEIDVDINPDSRYVYLAGGEPFLIKKFSELLEKVSNTDCEIVVNTNGTIITEPLVAQLSRFQNVCITISLDGFGALNEQLRQGSSWQNIDKNIDRFRELEYNLHAQSAVQKDNINELLPLADYICNKGIEHWTLIEVTEPNQFNWKHNTEISKSKLERLIEMPIIQKNVKSVMFLRHVMSHV